MDAANAWAASQDPNADPLVGAVLDRRYRLDAALGRGGMGAVYRGEQVFLHRPVAVKVLHPQFAAHGEFVERFRREAEIAVRLRSPHVVEVLDFGTTEDGRAYLVMELLEGESLQAVLRREGRLSPFAALRLVRELLEGLRAVHDAGIVHRDLKPDNLWLAPDPSGQPRLKLLDFGIAKVRQPDGAGTQLGLVMGTPEYLSPEQALGEAVDHRADLYSVGVVAFVLLTGRHPFPGLDARALLAAHVTQPFPSLAAVAPELVPHEALARFIERATVKDPAKRAASAGELLALLPLPESEAATQVSGRLRVTEGAPPAPTLPQLPAETLAPGAAPTPATAVKTTPTEVQAARLRDEGKELLTVTRTTLRDGARQAVSATLTSAFWLTRLLRWTLQLLGIVVRNTPRALRAARVRFRRAVAAVRERWATRNGRRLVLGLTAAGLLLVGLAALWWNRPVAKARRALADSQPALALTLLSDADPKDVTVLHLRGRALHAMKRPAEGIAAYRAAAAIDPGTWREDEVLDDLVSDLGGPRSREAGELLVAAKDDAIGPLVRGTLSGATSRSRWAAVELLRKLGKVDRADLALVHIADLGSDDCGTVTKAAQALAELGDSRAIEPLEEVAKRRGVFMEACEAPAAREALRALKAR